MRKRNKEKDREYARKKREKGQKVIFLRCRVCGEKTPTKEYKRQHHERKGGITCKICIAAKSADIMRKMQAQLSQEARKEHGKMACAKKTPELRSAATRKQWETIKSDKKKFNELRERMAKRSRKAWDEANEETRKKIIEGGIHNGSRSKASEKFKQFLIKHQLYNDFESEQIFHGFIPDEINHKRKIIIKYFGDYHHCNPKKYKDPDQYIRAIKRTVGEQWKRDRRRLGCYYKHRYKTIIVWDTEFRKTPDKVLKRLKEELCD